MPRFIVGDIVERTMYSTYALVAYPDPVARIRRFGSLNTPMRVQRVTEGGGLVLAGLAGSHNPDHFRLRKRLITKYQVTKVHIDPLGDITTQTLAFNNQAVAEQWIRDCIREEPPGVVTLENFTRKKISYHVNVPQR